MRLYAVGPTAKLLMLPVLLYHFERSARGLQVLIAFLVSCALLMVMSWIVAFDPGLALKSATPTTAFPSRTTSTRARNSRLCAVVLAYPGRHALARAENSGWRCLLIGGFPELSSSTCCLSAYRGRRW